MATTAQQIIEASYSRSTANDPGKLATDGELLPVANRIYHVLYACAAAAAPERFTAKTIINLIASIGALPLDIIDIRRIETAAGATVNVFPIEERTRGWHLAPAVYRQGLSLITRGNVGDPAAADPLTMWYLDAPTDLSLLTSTIDTRFPTRHIELIIAEVAMYLSTKDAGRDPGEFQKLKSFRDMQLEMFFRLSGLSMTALQSPHGGVIVQRLNTLMSAMHGAQAA